MLGKGFIDRRNHQVVPPFSCKEKDGTCDSVWTSVTSTKITRKDRYPIPLVTNLLNNWAAQRSTPSSTSTRLLQCRVAAGHEWKTAFRTRYGSFET